MAEQFTLFKTISGDTVKVPKRGKHYTQPRGYFAPPGSGPKDQTCGTCKHCQRDRNYSGTKSWAKCEKARGKWTHGRGSDILVKAPAYRAWEAP